ncbi:adenylate cyclase [Methylophilus rhizosphaerae]|uniref:Adenylate cyclase n=1 Tax=Methylophilus rhizosphaerae TaxID=492660 RepID=A0A1G9ET13_9PROT|nr:CHASE2 domain-containing protein [Methylophilus rhizosphaerae]SDK79244.1 adenylate cyclase [Methylophilus rhizosphaerae]
MQRLHPVSAKLSRRQAWVFLAASLVLAVLVGVGGLVQLAPVAQLDRVIFDTLQAQTAPGQAARDTVVVDIDEVSLAAVGQWPWPRYRIAALVERIAAGQPAAIALDILLPEADRTSLSEIRRTFKRDFDVDISFGGAPPRPAG